MKGRRGKGLLSRVMTSALAFITPGGPKLTDPTEQFQRKRRKPSKRAIPKRGRRTPRGRRYHRTGTIAVVARMKDRAERKRARRKARNRDLAARGGFGVESFLLVMLTPPGDSE